MPELLVIDALRAGYGEAVVLPAMSLSLGEGQVLALLGRNGTGKTTLINSIVGITRRFGGTLALGGQDITAMRPDQRARAGIGWVPQERNIFRSLTVEENMTAAAISAISSPVASSRCWQSAARSPSIQGFCCWTSRPRGWPRSSSRNCSGHSAPSPVPVASV